MHLSLGARRDFKTCRACPGLLEQLVGIARLPVVTPHERAAVGEHPSRRPLASGRSWSRWALGYPAGREQRNTR